MIDMIFAMITATALAALIGGSDRAAPAVTLTPPVANEEKAPEEPLPQAAAPSVIIGDGVQIGGGVVIGGAPAGQQAEPQEPTGKFTTATEVKPILTATKANWIGVREYGGNDLLYVTQLWSWRCGLIGMSIAINDGPLEPAPLPDCHLDFAAPNAILDGDGLPFTTHPLGSVESVTVHLTYDDLSEDSATFARSDVRIP